MKVKKRLDEVNFYLFLLDQLKAGNNPSKICKILNIKKQNLNYYIRKLKQKGMIEKKGYGTWEVKHFNLNTLTKTDKSIRGHAFIWKLKLNQKFEWTKLLKNYKLVRNCIPRVFIGKKKVWFGKKTITIYEPNNFYGKNAIESRKYATYSLLETIKQIEQQLNINLKPYLVNPSREHYALVKNSLAAQCNKNGEKMIIKDINGEWLWIDDSDGLNELETGNKNALVNNLGVQRWWNEMKVTKFEVTPKFIMESFGKMIQVQQMNADNIIKHQKVLDDMLITMKQIRDNLKKL